MSEWQPIETAPKDGTPIIVPEMRGPFCLPKVVRWMRCPLLGDIMEAAWRPINDQQRALNPSHWMHLPEPPK